MPLSLSSEALRAQIAANAEKIVLLHRRVREKAQERHRLPRHLGLRQRVTWEQACADFHDQYGRLAFPGGYGGALERLVAGDPLAMEAAICFLEVRPYFFRSGYMFKDILRKARRAPLTDDQAARLRHVLDALAAWKASKISSSTPGNDR